MKELSQFPIAVWHCINDACPRRHREVSGLTPANPFHGPHCSGCGRALCWVRNDQGSPDLRRELAKALPDGQKGDA